MELDENNNPVVGPIKRSMRIMHIKFRMTNPKGKGKDEWKIIPKATSSTIKKRNVSCSESGKIIYGSHHAGGCSLCREKPKIIGKKKTEFQRYMVKKEINDYSTSIITE